MRIADIAGAALLALSASVASGQTAPSPTPQNPGSATGPLGGYRGTSNDPGAGLAESPGAFAASPNGQKSGMLKGEYGMDLARRIADAQRLVDSVGHGRTLTDGDARRIRNLMREDFIAWRKQFDPQPSAYERQRDNWIVDKNALSPDAWATQRLKWLEAQRDWILSNGG